MRSFTTLHLLSAATVLLSAATVGTRLATDYGERTLRVESEAELSLATTLFEMSVDGRPAEGGPGRGGGGDRSFREVRSSARTDAYLASEDGAPTRVKRTFEDVAIVSELSGGREEFSGERSSPLAGLTLELSLDEDGELVAELQDGDEPEEAAALTALPMTLALDAFLPEEEVEVGALWNPESDAIAAALALAFDEHLYPRPERPERGGEGRERGGERGRGFRGGGGGGGGLDFLTEAEWEGEATLAELDADEGLARITLQLVGSGALADPEPGGGGGRRREFRADRAVIPVPFRDGSFEVLLEGELTFQLDGTPVGLQLGGTLTTERHISRERGDRQIEILTEQEGTLRFSVEVSEE